MWITARSFQTKMPVCTGGGSLEEESSLETEKDRQPTPSGQEVPRKHEGGCAPWKQPSVQFHFNDVCNFLPAGLIRGTAALYVGPCAQLLLKVTLTNTMQSK